MPRRRDTKPETKTLPDRLRIKGTGCHTIKEVIAMLYHELHQLEEAGFTHINGFDGYFSVSDKLGRPMTHYADGRQLAGLTIRTDQPYRSAADEHGL